MLQVIFSIVLIVNIGFGGAYVINTTKVAGKVLSTEFDFDGNIFVVTEEYTSSDVKLHKLTSANELVWTISLPRIDPVGKGPKMIVTSQNDLYLRYASYEDGFTFLYGAKSGSSNLTEIDHVLNICELFILDGNDNLFYCGANAAIKILRPNSTNPTEIKNLENYNVYREESVIVDIEGNVYFPIAKLFNYYSDEWLAFITKDEIENEVPEAQLIDFFHRDNTTATKIYITSVTVDEKNDLWLFITDWTNQTGHIKKVENSVLKTVYVDTKHEILHGLLAKDRMYVIALTGNIFTGDNSICYITTDDKIVEIPGLTNMTKVLSYINIVANKYGDAYFATYEDFTPELGPFVVVKADQADPIAIKTDESNTDVSEMITDSNGTLWIIGGYEIFTLEREETAAEKILNFSHLCSAININPVTKDVYISCYDGLFFIVDE